MARRYELVVVTEMDPAVCEIALDYARAGGR
jgi:hypothetical protein